MQENKVEPVRQNVYRAIDHDPAEVLLLNDTLQRMATKKIRNIQEMRPQVSSLLSVGLTATSMTITDAKKTLKHKMARGPK